MDDNTEPPNSRSQQAVTDDADTPKKRPVIEMFHSPVHLPPYDLGPLASKKPQESTDGAVNPGLLTMITSKGLVYIINKVGIPLLKQEFISLGMENIKGNHSISRLGLNITIIAYSLSNICVVDVQIPHFSLTAGSSGPSLQTAGISLSLSAQWKCDYTQHLFLRNESGSCNIKVTDVSLDVKFGVDSSGHDAFSVIEDCPFEISDVEAIEESSSLPTIAGKTLLQHLRDALQSDSHEIRDALKVKVSSFIDAVNGALKSLPAVIKLPDNVSEINYELLQSPPPTSTSVEIYHKGVFYSVSDPMEPPFTQFQDPPQLSGTNKMMCVWLTDYMVNTANFVYQKAGKMKYKITPEMMPPTFQVLLNTSNLKSLLPQLHDKFPDMAIVLGLNATSPPTLEIARGSANFTVHGEITVYAVDADSTEHIAFILGTEVHMDVTFETRSVGIQIISGNVAFQKAILHLQESNIGDFNVGCLQSLAEHGIKTLIIPTLNSYANAGIPLPTMKGLSFVGPTIALGQGFVLVSTDINCCSPSINK